MLPIQQVLEYFQILVATYNGGCNTLGRQSAEPSSVAVSVAEKGTNIVLLLVFSYLATILHQLEDACTFQQPDIPRDLQLLS